MSTSTKILLAVLVVVIGFNFFKDSILGVKKSDLEGAKEQVQERNEVMQKDEYVAVYFLSLNSSGEAVLKNRYRIVEKGTDRLKSSLEGLLTGPTFIEKQSGIFSEIPVSTKLISVERQGDSIIVNLSKDFESGGGADSLYSRIRQLIKTVRANEPTAKIYLYIDGKQADVLGGEGLIITQPLNENSLDG